MALNGYISNHSIIQEFEELVKWERLCSVFLNQASIRKTVPNKGNSRAAGGDC